MGKQCNCINSHFFPHRAEKCLLRKVNGATGNSIEQSDEELVETQASFPGQESQQLAEIYDQFFSTPWDEDFCRGSNMALASEVTESAPQIGNSPITNSSISEGNDSMAVPIFVVYDGPVRIEKVDQNDHSIARTSSFSIPERRRDVQCDCLASQISKHRVSKCKWKEYATAVGAIGITAATVGAALATTRK